LNGWDKDLALHALNIEEVPFQEMNGNVQGYAVERSVAVSPLAPHPFKTFFHEMAHVVLGHTRRDREGVEARLLVDSQTLSRSKSRPRAWRCCCSIRSICPARSLAGATSSTGFKAARVCHFQRIGSIF